MGTRMPNYRRLYEGTTYFFTVVTHKRRPFLCDEQSRRFLRETIDDVRTKRPFTIDAWVLLPDHLHCVWTLPAGDTDYSTRWGLIKAGFSKRMNGAAGHARPVANASRHRRRESAYWQRRFWEHMIRDHGDLKAHMDYVHYNPVKHGLARAPAEWEFSSFRRLVKKGIYDPEWASSVEVHIPGVGRE